MVNTEKYVFQKGDFLKKNQKKGSFMIYEGDNLSETTYKKMSLVLFFDPEAFEQNDDGVYEHVPKLYLGDKYKPSSETIDTEKEDYWISPCTEEEIQRALEKLKEYGLQWNEETFELTKIENGEVVRKIVMPDNTYDGHTIIPSNKTFIGLALDYCKSKSKTTTSYQRYDYGYYD